MAEEKDIALLADNDIIVEIEVQEAPTVVIDTTSTTTAEISGDSALGIIAGALPALAKEKTLADGISSIEGKFDNIKVDLTPVAKESTLLAESEAIKHAIASAKPDVDTTELAKQGNNPDATLTAIYKMLIGSNEPSSDIPEGVAERLALILEFFGIKPIQAYEFMTAEEVCSTLEEIVTTMDINLTPEQAKEITNNTLNKG